MELECPHCGGSVSVLSAFPWWYAAIVGIGGALLGNAVYAVLIRGWADGV